MDRQSKKMKTTQSEMGCRKWEDFDENLLREIFKRLTNKELFTNVSSVCRSWESGSLNFLFWKGEETLDLSGLNELFSQDYDEMAMKLMQLLEVLMNGRSSCSVTCIVFPQNLLVSDNHLAYLAPRSTELKRLILPRADMITGKGFSRAIRNWTEMEEISMGMSDFHRVHIIQELGINCKKLEVLHIHDIYFVLDEYYSQIIAQNLFNLKALIIESANIYRLGLRVLSSRCKQLDVLFLQYKFLKDRPSIERRRKQNKNEAKDVLRNSVKPLLKVFKGSAKLLDIVHTPEL